MVETILPRNRMSSAGRRSFFSSILHYVYLCSFFSLSPSPLPQDKLKPFLCYNISVYPVLGQEVGQPYTIQAYAKEGGTCCSALEGAHFVNSDAGLSFLPQLNLPFQMCLTDLGPRYRVTRFQRRADRNKEFSRPSHFPFYKGEIEVHRGETPCLMAQHSSN